MKKSIAGLIITGIIFLSLQQAYPQTIKIGTLAPDGSAWYASLRDMGEVWEKAADGKVNIRIYAIQGKRIATLCNSYQPAGYYSLRINIPALSKGCYLLDFNAGNYVLKKKLIVY